MNVNKKMLKKMNLQLFGQTYDPDNVTMYEHKDGTIPEKYNKLILKDVMDGSKVMQPGQVRRDGQQGKEV